MPPTLVVLAAGMSTRYGRLKQLEPIGPAGEALLDYGVYDACRAGFGRVVLIVRPAIEAVLRAHCAEWLPGVPIALAHQTLEQVPPGVTVPVERTKPWGTAHAALAASPHLDGPFAVSNADDWYGPTAYAALAAHLSRDGGHALVTYRLEQTLSAHGGVSRGICDVVDGAVCRVEEVHDIRRDGTALRGRGLDGRVRELVPDAPTSMNLWGFGSDILPRLRELLVRFFAVGPATDAEFLLSSAVGELAAAGAIRVTALSAGEAWMGVTFPDDREVVAARLRALVAAGGYPDDLRPAFATKEYL